MLKNVLLGFIFMFIVSFAWGETQDEKIKKLEERIEQLERQLAAATGTSDSAGMEEIKRQLEILAAEVEKLRSGEAEEIEVDESKRRALGLGSSAATVYSKIQGPSIAGYGEMLYENFESETDAGTPSGRTDQIDFVRAVVYFGYRFNEKILFNSEIEFEHAHTDLGGSVAVEFAHLDFALTDSITARGGMVLLPMGLINEFHEPNAYLGTHRPLTENVIIPTTWRENGAGVIGSHGIFNYRAYVVAGLNAANFTSSGLRNGRQSGARSKLGDPAFVGRLDVNPAPGIVVGGSFFAGNSIVFGTTEADLDVPTRIAEFHGEFKRHGFQVRGLYAHASLDDVTELNNFLALTGSSSVGESMNGGYIEAGYNVLSGRGEQSLTPYVRYESVDTQSEVPSGFLKNPARDQSLWTVGLEYKPISNIVVKADYIAFDNEANTGVDQFSILLGYSF
jgi:cell division protein FtsB